MKYSTVHPPARIHAKRFLRLATGCVLVCLSSTLVVPSAATVAAISSMEYAGMKVEGRYLMAPDGEKIVLRGVNKMSIWTDKGGESFAEIAKTGANAVRIVWAATGEGGAYGAKGTAAELDTVLRKSIAAGLIPMPECHDATGNNVHLLASIVDYWASPEVSEVLKKYEKYLLLNIANEVGADKGRSDTEWQALYKPAITKLRQAGIRVPLIIDPDAFGANMDRIFANFTSLIQHDPLRNLMFSVHMWWPSQWYEFQGSKTMAEQVRDTLKSAADKGIPLIIGEFAHKATGCTPAIPYAAIMEEAQKHEIGWFAWSWGPGNSDCAEMDMTTHSTFATLQAGWATEVVLTSPYSIQKTSIRPRFMQEVSSALSPSNSKGHTATARSFQWSPIFLAPGDKRPRDGMGRLMP